MPPPSNLLLATPHDAVSVASADALGDADSDADVERRIDAAEARAASLVASIEHWTRATQCALEALVAEARQRAATDGRDAVIGFLSVAAALATLRIDAESVRFDPDKDEFY